MPNTNTANGSSRLAIQRPVRIAGERLFRFRSVIVVGWGRLACPGAGGLQHARLAW
jgi:hypothetical protein